MLSGRRRYHLWFVLSSSQTSRQHTDYASVLFLTTEERPGHGVKLYQYCSGNIEDVVKRHGKVSPKVIIS